MGSKIRQQRAGWNSVHLRVLTSHARPKHWASVDVRPPRSSQVHPTATPGCWVATWQSGEAVRPRKSRAGVLVPNYRARRGRGLGAHRTPAPSATLGYETCNQPLGLFEAGSPALSDRHRQQRSNAFRRREVHSTPGVTYCPVDALEATMLFHCTVPLAQRAKWPSIGVGLKPPGFSQRMRSRNRSLGGCSEGRGLPGALVAFAGSTEVIEHEQPLPSSMGWWFCYRAKPHSPLSFW